MELDFLPYPTKALGKVVAILILLSFLPSFVWNALPVMEANAVTSETSLDVAEQAATYVMDQAIAENGGIKWNTTWSNGNFYDRPGDVAPIGFFFLQLYNRTGNTTYLEMAKGVARWLISKAEAHSGGYRWPTPDQDISNPGWWLSPIVSDVGEFFLHIYQTTGNTTYLDYATGAAQWLAAMAYWGEPGCFIPYNPPNRYGSQAAHGISPSREAKTVTFLLHLYQETGNATYLTYVKGTAEWLISGVDKESDLGGYRWRHNRDYSYNYHVAGNAMIAQFFLDVYEELGNATYVEHAKGALQWILAQTVVSGDMAKWPERPGSSRYYLLPFLYMYEFDHVNDLLPRAYAVTGNASYLDYAVMHANWVLTQAVEELTGGYRFPRFEEGSGQYYTAFENALVYNFLNAMYAVGGNASYLESAEGAFTWIVNNASAAMGGGLKWRMIDWAPDPEMNYPWNFWQGAAGIGHYLISTDGPAATVSLKPTEIYAQQIGYTFEVNVTIENVTNLYAFDIKIRFNEIFLEILSIAEGSFLSGGGPTFIVKNETTPGQIWLAISGLGPRPGMNDTGVLAAIGFNTTFTPTVYNLTIDCPIELEVLLADPQGRPISHREVGSTVRFWFVGDFDFDRDVDIFDVVHVAHAYDSELGDPHYEPICDIDNDNDVDIFDVVAACANYGKRV